MTVQGYGVGGLELVFEPTARASTKESFRRKAFRIESARACNKEREAAVLVSRVNRRIASSKDDRTAQRVVGNGAGAFVPTG